MASLQLAPPCPPPTTPAPPCPLCGRGERAELFEGARRYLLCEPCGLAVAPALPGAAQLAERAEYWAHKHNLRPDRTELVFRESHQEASYGPIRRLLGAAGTNRRLLEVGCAAGGFLDAMRRHGWRVDGIELARASVVFARARGLSVCAHTIDDLPEDRRESYDAVVALDVIEHVADPIGFLRGCQRALRRGGTLLILTPNLQGLSARLLAGAWEAACPDDHLWLFTPRSLCNAFESAGVRVDRVATWDVNPVPLLRRFRRQRAPGASGGNAPRDVAERTRRLALSERIGRSRLLRCLRGVTNRVLSSVSLGDKLVVVGTKR